MNVFACSPTSRPDLPIYFFARFLFSPAYLSKVGAPLALNLYTAVSNPITLQGRIALCQGALSHVDCRPALEALQMPYIIVASSKDGLVKPSHVAVLVESRGGEVRSIKRALSERSRAVVVWLRAGHEVFQEARKPMVNLFEQLATGYHERNDVAFLPLVPDDATGEGNRMSVGMIASEAARSRAAALAAETSALQTMNAASAAAANTVDPLKAVPGGKPPSQTFEDKFLDNAVSTMRNAAATSGFAPNPVDARGGLARSPRGTGPGSPIMAGSLGAPTQQVGDVPSALLESPGVPRSVLDYKVPATAARPPAGFAASGAAPGGGTASFNSSQLQKNLLLDPTSSKFSKRDKLLKKKDGHAPAADSSAQLPEVKEYMSWRVKRNKRRLQRIEACAITIQRAWRAYLTRTLVSRMRQQRAALDLQRWTRGCFGRAKAKHRKKQRWAVLVLQRCWRGYSGRALSDKMKREKAAAERIQRMYRGFKARRFINLVRGKKKSAAIIIQSAWRRFLSLRNAWKLREQRNAALHIQRVWRGFLGRARAHKESDRYLFAKSQSQGIEFGRQMLMEHKLHGTRLQSEVALLTKEKLSTEEKIEAVLAEIATFEQGVRSLEREMVELSRAEAEAAGTLDDDAKIELRENKVRLDREFAAMLVKIADRRETLSALETKLQQLDRARSAKREELKDLERKLVVLLETQQNELAAIRMRQERRQENMVEDAVTAVNAVLQGRDPGAPGDKYITDGQGGTRSRGMLADGSAGTVGSLPMTGGAFSSPGGTSGGAGRTIGGGGGGGGTVALSSTAGGVGGGGGGVGGPTPQQRAEAQALMASTETMMKFGFMSMSLT
jgi:hypothetical protein